MSFRERFKSAALHSLGKVYGHDGLATSNCVRFLYAILLVVYGDIVKSKSDELHLNIPNGMGSFENCAALVLLQLAKGATAPDVPGIFYCQGWRKNSRGQLRGHSFVLIVHPTPWVGEWLWILESTNSDADSDGDGVPDRFDWYRPVTWATIEKKWPVGLKLVQLLEP